MVPVVMGLWRMPQRKSSKSVPPAARWSHLESLLPLRFALRSSGQIAKAVAAGFARIPKVKSEGGGCALPALGV